MKKYGFGRRALTLLLALAMFVSMVPNVWAATGDIAWDTTNGGVINNTGLSGNINTNDTINWPIKIYDYLNDGMLFDYAQIQHTSVDASKDGAGAAYGGGTNMPQMSIGNDYTMLSTFGEYAYKNLGSTTAYKYQSKLDTSTEGAKEVTYSCVNAVKFSSPSYMHMVYDGNVGGVTKSYVWISNFARDNSKYYAKEDVQYVVVVYRTNTTYPGRDAHFYWAVSDSAYSTDYSAHSGSIDISNLGTTWNNTTSLDNGTMTAARDVHIAASTEWTYLVVDMKKNEVAANWDAITGNWVAGIGMGMPLCGGGEEMDISHIAYFSSAAEATAFGEDCVDFNNDPGEYLLGSSTTAGSAPSVSSNGWNFTYTSSASYSDDTYAGWATNGMSTTPVASTSTTPGYMKLQSKDAEDDTLPFYYVSSGVKASKVRYIVMVYKTENMSNSTTGFWVESGDAGRAGSGTSTRYMQTFNASSTWTYLVYNMDNIGTTDGDWNSYYKNDRNNIYQINWFLPGLDYYNETIDIAYVDYFSDSDSAKAFGEQAVSYLKNYSGVKGWNMGNNTAFSMLYASSGGGWYDTNSTAGGPNSWANGYYSYQIGKTYYETTTEDEESIANGYRKTAASNGYPVSSTIWLLNIYRLDGLDVSTLDLGSYTLYNTVAKSLEESGGVYTVGLLNSGLITVKGVDGNSYIIPSYKEDTVAYIAYLMRDALKIGERDSSGNYNYNFVEGTADTAYGTDANGKALDLAMAIRNKLGLVAPSSGNGNYTLPSGKTPAQYLGSYADTISKQAYLIGPFAECMQALDAAGKTFTCYDAAYYLLHNIFVGGSYNQVQDDYNYLTLSKATVSASGKEAYVFDGGFTTGTTGSSVASDDDAAAYGQTSTAAVQYDKATGMIYMTGAASKDMIYYQGTNKTTRFPFLPVTDPDANTPYAKQSTGYFADDGVMKTHTTGDTYVNRNYNYVMQANGEFIYHYQDALFFEFQGDDDVYLFVNGELILDIGGAHSITNVSMNMNDYVLAAQSALSVLKPYGYSAGVSDEKFEEALAKAIADTDNSGVTESDRTALTRWHKLNLVDGQSYSIDFYYMERHGWGANMRVATNIVMTDPEMNVNKSAYQDGAEIPYGGIIAEDKPVEYSFSMTNEGNNKLFNLSFSDYDIGVLINKDDGLKVTGANVKDSSGGTLDASDLMVRVTGYKDEEMTIPVAVDITFEDIYETDEEGNKTLKSSANDQLKQFMTDLTSNDGTDSGEVESGEFAGSGLWRHATISIRGIYYTLTDAQKEDKEFNNTVFVTANPAANSDTVINGEDTHQVRIVEDAIHVYQWADHELFINRNMLKSILGDKIKEDTGKDYTADEIRFYPCRADGTAYDYPALSVYQNADMYINYDTVGTKTVYIKVVYDDADDDFDADDVDDDGEVTDADTLLILPIIIYVVDVDDDTVVLDYGLKVELTGENGVTTNDYLTVPNIDTTYTIMGLSATEPAWLTYGGSVTTEGTWNNYLYNDVNRINITPASGKSLSSGDGTFTYRTEEETVGVGVTANVDKMYYEPTSFMDEASNVYFAVSVHEMNVTGIPNAVGPKNKSADGTYKVDITKEVQMYQKITVLPATVVYYEDDFSVGNSLNYVGTLTNSNDKTEAAFVHHGAGSGTLYQSPDQSVPYGQDFTYQTSDNAAISGNSLTTVDMSKIATTDTSKGLPDVLSFTFTGTGFEILGRTNAFDSASMVVTVKNSSDSTVKTVPVITEFNNTINTCSHEKHDTHGYCTLCNEKVSHTYVSGGECSVCGVPEPDYYLVGWINGADVGHLGDENTMPADYKFQDGKLKVTFNQDSYVFVKTTGNADWYMTDGYLGSGVTSATLYDTALVGTNADKLFVPGNVEVIFNLVTNSDGTVTLSYSPANEVQDSDARTIYFKNTAGWSTVNVYAWTTVDGVTTEYSKSWPGSAMTSIGGGIYSCTIPAAAETVIFNNIEDGMAEAAKQQTSDLTVSSEQNMYVHSGEGWITYSSDSVSAKDGYRIVYFKNTANWQNVSVYAWYGEGNETNGGWPGEAMTLLSDDIYYCYVSTAAENIIFNNGNNGSQTGNLSIPGDGYMYSLGTTTPGWNVYTTSGSGDNSSSNAGVTTSGDEVQQVPLVRVTDLEKGTYTVTIYGMPTYTFDSSYNISGVEQTFVYIDGIRIYQPMGASRNEYLASESGATFTELRNLILEGKAAVAVYNDTATVYTGNISWSENRNGYLYENLDTTKKVYLGNQMDSIDDYVVAGPNNEVYVNGNAREEALVLYVKESAKSTVHTLQVGVHGIDAGLFAGGTSTGVEATLYQSKLTYKTEAVLDENGTPKTDSDGNPVTKQVECYAWSLVDVIQSGTEQYYTIDYAACPTIDIDGTTYYQVALYVRNGMASFTNLKHQGLDINSIVSKSGNYCTDLYYNDAGKLVNAKTATEASTPELSFLAISGQMRSAVFLDETADEDAAVTPETPDVPETPEEPEVTEPETTVPEATEPEVTEPEATEPDATEPEVTEPEATEPEATEPDATEPEATTPETDAPAGGEDSGEAIPGTGDLYLISLAVLICAAVLMGCLKRRLTCA